MTNHTGKRKLSEPDAGYGKAEALLLDLPPESRDKVMRLAQALRDGRLTGAELDAAGDTKAQHALIEELLAQGRI